MTTPICNGCGKKIREYDPHIDLIDFDTGEELLSVHASEDCQRKAVPRMAELALVPKEARILRHFHTCDDPNPGFDCSGGCFAGAV